MRVAAMSGKKASRCMTCGSPHIAPDALVHCTICLIQARSLFNIRRAFSSDLPESERAKLKPIRRGGKIHEYQGGLLGKGLKRAMPMRRTIGDKCRQLILKHGRPMLLGELLAGMGRPTTALHRSRLRSHFSICCDHVFVKVGVNTFDLYKHAMR